MIEDWASVGLLEPVAAATMGEIRRPGQGTGSLRLDLMSDALGLGRCLRIAVPAPPAPNLVQELHLASL